MDKPKRLLWLDLETTGLNPDRDAILELAWAFSDFNRPFDISDVQSLVAHFDLASDMESRKISPVVIEMHVNSGLWRDCSVSQKTLAMLPNLMKLSHDFEWVLAGSSIHFDRAFLRTRLPDLALRLSHRLYDVTAVKLFCRSMGMPELKKAQAHRAEADVRESVLHARKCAEWLGVSPQPH